LPFTHKQCAAPSVDFVDTSPFRGGTQGVWELPLSASTSPLGELCPPLKRGTEFPHKKKS